MCNLPFFETLKYIFNNKTYKFHQQISIFIKTNKLFNPILAENSTFNEIYKSDRFKGINLNLYSADFNNVTLRRPLHKKLRMRWFFNVSKVKESSFFLIGSHWPPKIFQKSFFRKYQFQPFQISFFSGFLYHDLVLSQMVLLLIRKNEIKEKKRCLLTLTNL